MESPSLWELIVGHWVFVAVAVVLFGTAAGAAAYLSTPVYRASVVVLPAESKTPVEAAMAGLGNLGNLVGLGAAENQSTVEAVALLQSREFAENFIRDHNLIPVLFADRWDAARSAWRPDRWSPRPDPTLYDAYRKFDRSIRRVSEDKKTGLVTLSIDWTDAAVGARWANEMVDRINELMRQRTIAEADASVALLMSELKAAPTIDLQAAIARTIDTYVKSRTLAKVRMEYAFKVIDPGRPSGPRDYVRPQRALYLIGGTTAGFGFAVFIVVTWDFIKRQRGRRTA